MNVKRILIILSVMLTSMAVDVHAQNEDAIERAKAAFRARQNAVQQGPDTTKTAKPPVNAAFEQAMKQQQAAAQAQSDSAVTIAEGTAAIADSAFFKKANLQRLVIPASVQRVGRHTIDHCFKLADIVVDGDNPYLKSVDNVIYSKNGDTLLLCSPAKRGEFVVPATVKAIAPGAFGTCKRLTSIVLPKGLKEIPDEAFQGCWALAKINLPEGLTRIGKRAFDGTIIQKMNMPTTMKFIDDEAFINTSIVEVNLRVNEPFELGEDVFREIHVTRLNVPAAGLSKFKNHPKWGKFGRITPTHSYWTVDLP